MRIPPVTGSTRWSFVVDGMLGETTTRYELRDDALVYVSDDPFDSSVTVPWSRIGDGATAVVAGIGGRGGPDLPQWAPNQLEWLTLSVRDGAGFMRRLPAGPIRDDLVAAVRARLGTHWLGEGLPLGDTQRRLGIVSEQWNKTRLVGVMLAVLALLILAIVLLALLLTPLFLIPASVLVGGWLLRRGLAGYRASASALSVPVASAARVTVGPVRLEGRAQTSRPTTSPVSGRTSVWWDVAVFLMYREAGDDQWQQVAARHGGTIDVVELEDASGRVPVWLDGAALLLAKDTWQSGRETLPAPGIALLDELGFPWRDGRTIRVVEQRLEVDAPLTVLGTASRRRDVVQTAPTFVDRVWRSIVTGTWRRQLVAAMPRPLRIPLAIAIGYLDMMTRLGIARERPFRVAGTPPPMAGDALLVWQGPPAAPFFVSNQPTGAALTLLRQRSLLMGAAGVAALVFALWQLVTAFR